MLWVLKVPQSSLFIRFPVEDPVLIKTPSVSMGKKKRSRSIQGLYVKGIDNCPTEFGPKFNGGCPIDDPIQLKSGSWL